MKPILLALALLICTSRLVDGATFSLVGRSTHMRLTEGASSIDVKVGKVFEADANGLPVPGHALTSLAAIQPTIVNGTTELGGETVSFVTLQVSGLASVPGFSAACPGGAAPVAALPLDQASINVTVFYNIAADLSLPYGNGTTNVTAGGIKWNIDAQGWPFCSASNQLMVELAVFTSAEEEDEPVLFDDDGAAEDVVVEADTNSTVTSEPVTANATDSAEADSPASNETAPSVEAASTEEKTPTPARRLAARRLLNSDKPRDQVGGGGQPLGEGKDKERPQRPELEGAGAPAGGDGGAPDAKPARPQAGAGAQVAASGKPPKLERPAAGARPPRAKRDRAAHPNGRAPKLFAALLSAEAAAALDLETIAYDRAVEPTAAYNVSVYMKPKKEAEEGADGAAVSATKLLLGFPAFDSLHYDPTMALTTPEDVGYTADTTANPEATAAPQNAAGPALRAGAGAVAGAVMALLLLA
ncbi:MAG: hypothetical protein J3K34DRAFT_502663 [Monoraphidium minutum]|nr:MAG: hypothetical protein J3K34DRAFT_502663 [Monoraphidium minutum]